MTGHPSINRTQVLSVHKFRRTARRKERAITADLERSAHTPIWTTALLAELPNWASGVRVEKAGVFSWCVVATERPGH